MQLYLDAFKKLFDSILGNDFIIFVAYICAIDKRFCASNKKEN